MSAHRAAAELRTLAELLNTRAGLSMPLLQGPSFASVVKVRMSALASTSVAEYRALVVTTPEELTRLACEIAVPETWLFRYPASFESLREHFSRIRTEGARRLTAASIGCATGVEAWCIAATALSAGWTPETVVVHAIDRNVAALAVANSATAPSGSVRGDLPSWAAPWIRAEGRAVTISAEVHRCLRVTAADVVKDPPPFTGPIDAVLCRNVMIYLDLAERTRLRQRLVEWAGDAGLVYFGHADGLNEDRLLEAAGPPAAFVWRRASAATRAPLHRPAARPNSAAPAQFPRRTPPSAAITKLPAPTTNATTTRADAALDRVRTLVAAKDFDRAKSEATHALVTSPAQVDLLELLAGIHAALDEFEESVRVYQRLVYLDPQHGPALLALSELSAALGRHEESARFRLRASRVTDA